MTFDREEQRTLVLYLIGREFQRDKGRATELHALKAAADRATIDELPAEKLAGDLMAFLEARMPAS